MAGKFSDPVPGGGRDPGDKPPGPLLSPAFFLMMGFCLICVIAGCIVALVLPRIFPEHPATPTPATAAAPPLGNPPPPR